MEKSPVSIFWFRRDLRLDDNTALFYALMQNQSVQPIFIFDDDILNDLDPFNRQISFIYSAIKELKEHLNQKGSDLWIFYGKPVEIFRELSESFLLKSIYFNNDYEPYARKRDEAVVNFCKAKNIELRCFKDQVIFEKSEVVKPELSPYTVFTPYSRKWKEALARNTITINETELLLLNLHKGHPVALIDLSDMGFQWRDHGVGSRVFPETVIKNYHLTRDLLALDGTSLLSVHLRFGTISIRRLVKLAMELNETYLNELIWREFYMQILWHFPQVVTRSFKPAYDNIPWNKNPEDFNRWCTAQTGYPIVDAAMNQLLQTGFMHNRGRMIVASFLSKHLLIDWRKGEAFFARHLTDFELSSNNGGWQWAAGSGCDAVPYFRIFNPYEQTRKFDPELKYINKWNGGTGMTPMIEHNIARERCLSVYKKALMTNKGE